jgi:hypothetical protein
MLRNSLSALVLGLSAIVLTPGPARADVDIDIGINMGYGGFYGRNISCRPGWRIVERRFNHVRARDCKGSRYDYTGRRNGKWYIIGVDARSGRISEVRRWWR